VIELRRAKYFLPTILRQPMLSGIPYPVLQHGSTVQTQMLPLLLLWFL
jgi:hypothetical protein